jgi:tRNA 5-methylaminomethyl-2-thiouridine biosynthesis bifunctional protein
VFLAGNGLPARWSGRERFVILETGFGLGLNFLAAWEALEADPRGPARLHFISTEKHPFARADLARALTHWDSLAPFADALLAAWPPPLAGFHRLVFDNGRVMLTLLLGDARELLPQLEARVDAFFLDGFAPAKNPELWSPEIVRELARLAAPGATLATWTVAGGVRSALADAGFAIEKREGFGRKREMLAGRWPGDGATQPPGARRAVVVGGGLAGTLVAERLGMRSWDVALVEHRAEASGASIGLLRPIANLRDTLNARASRAAFLYALQHFRGLKAVDAGLRWEACGALQLAADDDEAARYRGIATSQGYPPELLAFVERDQASELAGLAIPRPGWWFPSGAWVSLARLAAACLARAGVHVRRYAGRRVERLEREGNDWRALDAEGRVIAEAPVLVLANASDARRLAPQARLALERVRGQLTYLPPSPRRRLTVIVSGDGYVGPLPEGGHCIGATYQHDDGDEAVREADHRENLERARRMLPDFAEGVEAAGLGGWTGFRSTVADRMPVFGALESPGLYAATGLGSRGLLWGPIGAELLACALAGEPAPLPRDLAGAMAPQRFLS